MNSRGLLSILIALTVATIAFVAVTISNSDAQEQVTCPDGSVLADDGKTCITTPTDGVNDNVTTTTSCLQGVLSEDGQTCIVPRLDADTTGATGNAGAAGGTITAPVPIFTG